MSLIFVDFFCESHFFDFLVLFLWIIFVNHFFVDNFVSFIFVDHLCQSHFCESYFCGFFVSLIFVDHFCESHFLDFFKSPFGEFFLLKPHVLIDCGFKYFNQRAIESASLHADCAASMLKMAALQTLSLIDLIVTPVAITGACLAPWVWP